MQRGNVEQTLTTLRFHVRGRCEQAPRARPGEGGSTIDFSTLFDEIDSDDDTSDDVSSDDVDDKDGHRRDERETTSRWG